MSNGQDSAIRDKLKELEQVSRDLDRHSQMSKSASHPVQAQQVRKRIDELTAQQTALMNELVGQHPSDERRSTYHSLSAQVDSLKEEIRGCEDMEKLVELEARMDEIVDSWIHSFQVIVSELAGVQPPNQAVYDK